MKGGTRGNPDIKMEKNKTILVSCLIGALLIILAISVWFLFTSTSYDKTTLNFGKGVVVGTKGERIQVLSPTDPSVVLGEWELPVYEILPDHQSQSLIVITNESPQRIHRLTFSGETPELKQVYDIDYSFTEETEVRWVEDTGFFYEPSTQTFTMINPEQLKETTHTIKVKTLEDWSATNDYLFYAYDEKITVYDIANEKVLETITLESPTSALFVKSDLLHVISQFGEESDFTTVLSLEMPTLLIQKLSSIDETGLSFYNGMVNDELIYYRTVTGKNNQVNYESYNIVNHEADKALTLNVTEDEIPWFEQQFVYVVNASKVGRIQSIYSVNPLWESSQSTDWIYPIW